MDALAIAARRKPAPTITQLVEWITADFTIRWTTGGFVKWGAKLFEAVDQTYGTVGELPTFSDGIDNQNTRYDITILPSSDDALAAMADRKHQGSLIQIWDADIDREWGGLIGVPDLLFRGETDFARLVVGDGWQIVMECGTEEARLNEPNEDRRLSAPHHRSVWPREAGLDFVTGLGRKIYWRQGEPSGVSSGGGYTSGGGGGLNTL